MKRVLRLVLKPFRAAWHAYVRLYRGRRWYAKLLAAIATLFLLVILYLGAVDVNLFWLFGQSPSMHAVRNTRPPQASEIYSDDGILIGKFYSENRTPVAYTDVAPAFWQALVDTEDERFYSHPGIDLTAIFGAAKDFALHGRGRGASTLTQQLAKNLFRTRTDYSTGLLGNVPGLRMLVVKSKEWVTALKLEWEFSKEEILTMYANTVDFGSNAYGIKTAAAAYFGCTPAELRPEQAAVLVGMLKATTTYNPRRHPEQSRQRRNVVLERMVQHGHLTRQQYDSLAPQPITLHQRAESRAEGQARYFRDALADELRPWCEAHGYDLYGDGLRIVATIDTRLQHYAEEAVLQQMEQVQKSFNDHWGATTPWRDRQGRELPAFIENIARHTPRYRQLERQFPNEPDSVWSRLQEPREMTLFSYNGPVTAQMSTLDSIRAMVRFMHCGFVAIEPQTRFVRAWVGDIDYDTWQYDKVTALRQPGSTFKLFVYTEAMEQGLTPCTTRSDTYVSIGDWHPHNADGTVSDSYMTLRGAFARSVNTVAAKLGHELGIARVARTARRMGITSHLEEVPALALGASDVTLLEMAGAYATVANDGLALRPHLVSRILDRDGNEIYNAESEEATQAIAYRSAFLMQQMLMGGLSGTSWKLRTYVAPFLQDTDFGGKTGTSNNHSDAWFIGVTPRLVCGVWVGGEYRSIHFRTGQLGQGGATALPVCGLFLQKALADPVFSHYRARFADCRDASINASEWQCGWGYTPLDTLMQTEGFQPDFDYDDEASGLPDTGEDDSMPSMPNLPSDNTPEEP